MLALAVLGGLGKGDGMAGFRRKLPPLSALVIFEAAARHASFTKAAGELGITQAAVSRQVHLLEEQFECQLFLRLHRKVELTSNGRILSLAAAAAFQGLFDAVSEMSREGPSGELAIAATVAFSHFWLLPRISEFGRLHPTIRLRIV